MGQEVVKYAYTQWDTVLLQERTELCNSQHEWN